MLHQETPPNHSLSIIFCEQTVGCTQNLSVPHDIVQTIPFPTSLVSNEFWKCGSVVATGTSPHAIAPETGGAFVSSDDFSLSTNAELFRHENSAPDEMTGTANGRNELRKEQQPESSAENPKVSSKREISILDYRSTWYVLLL